MGQSVLASSRSSHSILFCSSGMLTLMAAWQAMLAAMLVRILSRFSDCSSRSNCSRISCSRCSTSPARNSGGGCLHRDGARAEGFDLEAVAIQFVGDFGEDRHLARRQLDDERHQQLLPLGRFCQSLLADFLEQNALVRDVLIDDPQSLRIDGQDKRIANLPDRLEGGQRLQTDGSIVVRQLPANSRFRRVPCIAAAATSERLRPEARDRNCGICLRLRIRCLRIATVR